MKPTKSKQRLSYHKKLRSLEQKKRALQKEMRTSKEFVTIPKILVGYKLHLSLVESMKNKDEGLSEAIAASTSVLVFSEKPFRLCNLKSYNTPYDYPSSEKMEAYFFKNKLYQKGKLTLLDISEQQFKKLSPAAQKYFSEYVEKINFRSGRYVYTYRPNIPKSYLRECEEKLYWDTLSIPNSEAESEAKRIENWLDYKKQCELWHYEGIGHYHWRRKKSAKQERALLKLEIKKRAADFPEQ